MTSNAAGSFPGALKRLAEVRYRVATQCLLQRLARCATAQSGKQCGTPADIRRTESVQKRRKNYIPPPPRRKWTQTASSTGYQPLFSQPRNFALPQQRLPSALHPESFTQPAALASSFLHFPSTPVTSLCSLFLACDPIFQPLAIHFFGLDDFARPPSRVSQARTRFRRLVYPPKRAPLVPCLLTSTLLQSLVPLHCCAACTISLAGCASAYFSSPRVPA